MKKHIAKLRKQIVSSDAENVGIIISQDKDSTRKNFSGLLHAMIKVKIQKIALLAVVGWHHQCPNSLFHNSSRIHKCQQWQGMTRVPPPKVPKWFRLTRMQKGQDMSKQSTKNSAVQTHWIFFCCSWPPLLCSQSMTACTPSERVSSSLRCHTAQQDPAGHVGPKGMSARKPKKGGKNCECVTKNPTEHSLRVRATPGQWCENEQQKLFAFN